MIGQHPELAGVPELKLFCYPTIGALEASLPRFWIARGITHRSPGLVRALAEYAFGDQRPASISSARAWLKARAHWAGPDVLDVLQTLLRPRHLVEKSPENVLTDAALDQMSAAYPNARYLHLTRHPVTTQRSMQVHYQRVMPVYTHQDEPMAAIHAWYETHRRILCFTARLPRARTMQVRAEDILDEPEKRLRAIAAWLKLRTDDQTIEQMKHPERSPFARLGPAKTGIIGGNDHAFLCDPIPHQVPIPKTLDPPEGWRAEASIWPMVEELARRLGYGDMSE